MNIILVFVDSLNKGCLKFYDPESECRTPNLDTLAAEHVRQYAANVSDFKGE